MIERVLKPWPQVMMQESVEEIRIVRYHVDTRVLREALTGSLNLSSETLRVAENRLRRIPCKTQTEYSVAGWFSHSILKPTPMIGDESLFSHLMPGPGMRTPFRIKCSKLAAIRSDISWSIGSRTRQKEFLCSPM